MDFWPILVVALCIPASNAFAEIPKGNEILKGSASPDGKWAVTVPTIEELEANESARNLIVEAETRIKRAWPDEYAAAVKDNQGNGEAYPEGFTVDVQMKRNKATPPLRFYFGLTSNPKQIPELTEIEAVLTGTLSGEGRMTWTDFRSYGRKEIKAVRVSIEATEAKLQEQIVRIEKRLSGDALKVFQAEQEEWRAMLDRRFEPSGGDGFCIPRGTHPETGARPAGSRFLS